MARRRNGGDDDEAPPDLTLFGVGDSELLGIIDDLADENGWTHTLDVRLQLGERVDEERKGPRRSGVGPRLSWLRRYGWLEQKPDDRSCWRLTAMGHALLADPTLTRSVEAALSKLNPAQRLRLTKELAEFGHDTSAEIRTALRRQWVRSLGR